MTKLLDRLCSGLAVLAAGLFLFCTFSICFSIMTRSLRILGPVWVVQFNEYAMLWITFLGTAYLLMKNRHVSIQIVTGRLGVKGKKVIAQVHAALGILLCLGLFFFTLSSTWEHFVRGVIDVQAVDVPKGYVLMVIPFGFLLLTLQFLRKFIEGSRREEGKGPASSA